MAYFHAGGGYADSTFYWLNKAIDEREGQLFASSVPCYGLFTFVHSDPRWDAVLGRMKIGRCQK